MKKLVSRFRKHDYNISRTVLIRGVNCDVYECQKCGSELSLDEWQMKSLPWDMARGCKGKKK